MRLLGDLGPAAVGGGNPNYYVERQVALRALGIVLLMVLRALDDYRRLRALSPMLVLVSLGLLVAVLAMARR